MRDNKAAESSMNGAAIVLSDGREVPITETMVQGTLEALAEEESETNEHQDQNVMSFRAHG